MYVVANLIHAISVARLCVGNVWVDMLILLDGVRCWSYLVQWDNHDASFSFGVVRNC